MGGGGYPSDKGSGNGPVSSEIKNLTNFLLLCHFNGVKPSQVISAIQEEKERKQKIRELKLQIKILKK